MNQRTPKETLKSFSWIYVILAALFAISGILVNTVPEIADLFKDNQDLILGLNATAIFTTLFYLWYFWLSRRIAAGKSSGLFFMVLLILGIIGKIVHVISTRSIVSLISLDSIVDLMGLYFVYKVRNED